MDMKELKEELNRHLTEDILPFWMGLTDVRNGGFYGEVSSEGVIDKNADKGCILNSRILWTFSQSYIRYGKKEYLETAAQAYRQLREVFFDKEFGGVYWSVRYDGTPADTVKHTYNQAFAIYGLCAYYEATKDEEALELALGLYELIEDKCRDEIGYLEGFDRQWKPAGNDKLSENGVEAYRTMNTLLHIFEAYTELYRVTGSKKAGKELLFMIRLITDKIYAPDRHRLDVFFDRDYNSIIDLQSYGHDIEAAWLIERGLNVLQYGRPYMTKGNVGTVAKDDRCFDISVMPVTDEDDVAAIMRLRSILDDLTTTVYERAYENGLLYNECENGIVDTGHIWWAQCEAMIGFMNGYEHEPDGLDYFEAVTAIWDTIKERYIVKAGVLQGKEWYWGIDKNGMTDTVNPIAGMWKCPYHNSRMCMELTDRLK